MSKEVRHQGLLVGVEFDDTISGVEVKHGCLDRHLLITAIGAHIIRLIPPLIVTEEDCDKAVAIIEETVKALEKIKNSYRNKENLKGVKRTGQGRQKQRTMPAPVLVFLFHSVNRKQQVKQRN